MANSARERDPPPSTSMMANVASAFWWTEARSSSKLSAAFSRVVFAGVAIAMAIPLLSDGVTDADVVRCAAVLDRDDGTNATAPLLVVQAAQTSERTVADLNSCMLE